MKKVDLKTCIKIAAVVFGLYLCIYYWPSFSGFLKTVIAAVMPVIVGAVIAYPLNILMSFYERHFFPKSKKKLVIKGRRAICLTLAYLSLVGVIALVTALVVPQLTECIRLLIAEVPIFYEAIVAKLAEFDFVPEDIIEMLTKIDWQSKSSEIFSTVTSGIGNVVGVVASTVTTVVSGVTTFVLAVIFSAYVLSGKEKLGSQIKKLMKRYAPSKINEKVLYVLNVADDSFHKFIVAQCTEALILGTLCTLGMLILRLPYAAMIGTVICVTAFIPVVGGLIGGGIGAFLILMESPSKALIFLIFLILLQNFEGDVIYPKVVGASMGLPSLWVLAAVTVGGTLFGMLGMLIGVPIASTMYRLIKNDVNKNSDLSSDDPPMEDTAPEAAQQGT